MSRASAGQHESPVLENVGQKSVPNKEVKCLTHEDHDEGDDDHNHPAGFFRADAIAFYEGLLFFLAPLVGEHIHRHVLIHESAVVGQIGQYQHGKGHEIGNHHSLGKAKSDTAVINEQEDEGKGYRRPQS